MFTVRALTLLRDGAQRHKSARLQDAAALYRKLLAWPQNSDALHLLGVTAHEVGDRDASVYLIHRAIRLLTDNPKYHNNNFTVFGEGNAFHECHRRSQPPQ